jgi:hypothetical protein
MNNHFIRIEVWRGKPTDVSFGEDKPVALEGKNLVCWNDFEFKAAGMLQHGPLLYDVCSEAYRVICALEE